MFMCMGIFTLQLSTIVLTVVTVVTVDLCISACVRVCVCVEKEKKIGNGLVCCHVEHRLYLVTVLYLCLGVAALI